MPVSLLLAMNPCVSTPQHFEEGHHRQIHLVVFKDVAETREKANQALFVFLDEFYPL